MPKIDSLTQYHLFAISFLIFGAVWVALSQVTASPATSGGIPAPAAGFLAPDFTLYDLEGQQVRLADLRGRAVIVNFWASWCPPCREEMPAMQNLQNDIPREQLLILAVNATHQDSLDNMQSFLAQHQLTFPILLDPIGETMRAYQVRSLPTTFFIRPDGIIDDVILGGPMSSALLRSRADALLAPMVAPEAP